VKAIGLMSGTSLDGVTIVLISSDVEGNDFEVLAEETTLYDATVREALWVLEDGGTTYDVAVDNMYLGRLYGGLQHS
jgi:1,6-anhydro-N-acetylmuramate kinase